MTTRTKAKKRPVVISLVALAASAVKLAYSAPMMAPIDNQVRTKIPTYRTVRRLFLAICSYTARGSQLAGLGGVSTNVTSGTLLSTASV